MIANTKDRDQQDDNTEQSPRLVKLRKFLTLLLVHRPARFPIPLDDAGYASLEEVLHILKGLPNFRWAGRTEIESLIAAPGRWRFELDPTGQRIRAVRADKASETAA